MHRLDPAAVPGFAPEIAAINTTVKSTLRLITFSRAHSADLLLDAYLGGIGELTELMSVKNAQLEAQNPAEVEEYHANMRVAMDHVMAAVEREEDFTRAVQLFRIFRWVSPEAYAQHPNRFRDRDVQIGRYLCPAPQAVPALVNGLFADLPLVTHPIVRAIYFHHELIRIHPFADGNGRATRVAKNWMLLYELYPPIFVNTGEEKAGYIDALAESFAALERDGGRWQGATERFFRDELRRIERSAGAVHDRVEAASEA